MGKSIFFVAALVSTTMLIACNSNSSQNSSSSTTEDTLAKSTPGQRLDQVIENVEQSAAHTTAMAQEEVKKAEAAMQEAKQDLADAKDRGDAKAEKEAQKALDKATQVWENTKKGAEKAVDATKNAARRTGEAVDTSLQRAGRKVDDLLNKD